jgi:DNA-binding helix-hairpin-helix protein with protein kinase domain
MLYEAEALTPEYAPMEFYHAYKTGRKASENWDRFALAVCFYQLIFGIHPYAATCNEVFCTAPTFGEKIKNGLYVHGSNKNKLSAIPPLHSNFLKIPIALQNLFHKAFAVNGNNETVRPSAEDWYKELYTVVKNAESVTARH